MTAFAAARSLLIACAGFLLGLLLAAMALPLAARAEPPKAAPAAKAETAAADETRTISIVVYGNDPCPTGKDDEIIVCAREPESERYRIPKRFRGKKVQPAPGNSWANKVRTTEDVSREAAGLPNTCSMVGTGGQSGCFAQFQTRARLQRQQDKEDAENGGVPQD
ncbi:MAG: hypothetical protein ACTHOJ_11375 [Sphingomonas oligoaromativorans]|jgi:hypothetical protein|uniref:hypothetical protein n=1 Tax=Sphingomonas oligoaromativorans TaxID=575322 RepID=UPI001FB908EA|nr:hypothetical protein [Sphingomonas oligoaromativorans]NIJ34849.1 hypothetical protein [Sphingomonas oligoaromativorans]